MFNYIYFVFQITGKEKSRVILQSDKKIEVLIEQGETFYHYLFEVKDDNIILNKQYEPDKWII